MDMDLYLDRTSLVYRPLDTLYSNPIDPFIPIHTQPTLKVKCTDAQWDPEHNVYVSTQVYNAYEVIIRSFKGALHDSKGLVTSSISRVEIRKRDGLCTPSLHLLFTAIVKLQMSVSMVVHFREICS